MDPYGKKELLAFYNWHLQELGDRPEALCWTPRGQIERYKALLEIAGDIESKEILDFGCGMGDLYGFIRERGIETVYCGIDINEKLLRIAGNKYPGAEFFCMDIEEEDLNRSFDIIFICGTFNLRVAGIEETMKNVLKRLFGLCREAMHLNAVSAHSVYRGIELYYVKPEDILSFAIRELSPKVVLRHGVVKGDIFLSVYRV
jgi:SAM-dependent methyltransferase